MDRRTLRNITLLSSTVTFDSTLVQVIDLVNHYIQLTVSKTIIRKTINHQPRLNYKLYIIIIIHSNDRPLMKYKRNSNIKHKTKIFF